jgi:hypothetical protein
MVHSFDFKVDDNLDPFDRDILNSVHHVIANQKDPQRVDKYLRLQFEPHSELFKDLLECHPFSESYLNKKNFYSSYSEKVDLISHIMRVVIIGYLNPLRSQLGMGVEIVPPDWTL